MIATETATLLAGTTSSLAVKLLIGPKLRLDRPSILKELAPDLDLLGEPESPAQHHDSTQAYCEQRHRGITFRHRRCRGSHPKGEVASSSRDCPNGRGVVKAVGMGDPSSAE